MEQSGQTQAAHLLYDPIRLTNNVIRTLEFRQNDAAVSRRRNEIDIDLTSMIKVNTNSYLRQIKTK